MTPTPPTTPAPRRVSPNDEPYVDSDAALLRRLGLALADRMEDQRQDQEAERVYADPAVPVVDAFDLLDPPADSAEDVAAVKQTLASHGWTFECYGNGWAWFRVASQ
jgi:hypothetical protein